MYEIKPANNLGFTGKYCPTCNTNTPHYLLKGDGCVVKICVACYQKKAIGEVSW